MFILVSLVLVFMLSFSDTRLDSARKAELVKQVSRVAQELGYQDGVLEINPELNYYQQGVYILIYTGQGRLIEGRIPYGFSQDTDLVDKQHRQLDISGQPYYIYDEKQSFSGAADIWIRGLTAADNTATFDTMLQTALIALPFLLVFAALGGYQVTRRAFLPVEQIRTAADRISEGSDLSQRINLSGSKDELSALAATFDNMLSRLQDSFAREKQLTADASHELRTPVAVIIAQCEYALEQLELEAETEQLLDVILRQARKMSGLISQLLALARADRAAENIQLELFDFSLMLEMIVAEQALVAREKGLELTEEISPDIQVQADQTLLTRLVLNLVDNAIKFTNRGGWIKVSLKQEGREAVLTVADNGIGIAAADLGQIWQRFYRAASARSGSSGSGLGLAMVQWIAEQHGGQLAVKSQPGQGSSFTFTLPLAS